MGEYRHDYWNSIDALQDLTYVCFQKHFPFAYEGYCKQMRPDFGYKSQHSHYKEQPTKK
jgi:hypothetical protein